MKERDKIKKMYSIVTQPLQSYVQTFSSTCNLVRIIDHSLWRLELNYNDQYVHDVR